MKNCLVLLFTCFLFSSISKAQTTGLGSRWGEVFQRTDLVNTSPGLNDPWEITYGPDNKLWITESKGYKIQRLDPNTGVGTTVLDLNTFTPNSWGKTWTSPSPQGGLMGLAIHPEFNATGAGKNFVYIAYVHDYVGRNQTYNGELVRGHLFRTWLVRLTWNTSTSVLESPIVMCDTITGSNDHNSGRLIIKPEGATNYLFYAVGDMGAGQFDNIDRTIKAQTTRSYEGKILRFNLEQDADSDASDKWIPNDNPFTEYGKTNAVWALGIRNNQGFAYGVVNGVGRLYGSSHGPFSDDELNMIERAKNYGHPIVIGYNDGNYNGAKAGPSASSLPAITTEAASVTSIGAVNYGEPLYSFYAAPRGSATSPYWSIQHIYTNNTMPAGAPYNGNRPQSLNAYWASEGIAGMDIYTGSAIPGWKNSLLIGCLKGGKILRMQLEDDGLSVKQTLPYDTIGVLRSPNRFRDLAISPDGKSIFTVIDRSSSTSGPTTDNPIISACAGCVQKYTFIGYENVGNTSTLPDHIDIAPGTANSCQSLTSVTINSTNNAYWVPITDSDGNIVAEVKANGNNLGTLTSSVYVKSGSLREHAYSKTLYLNRNVTITPQTQPTSAVNIRIYLTAAEYIQLRDGINSASQPTNISGISSLGIFKNQDNCGPAMTSSFSPVTNNFQLSRSGNGYVLHATISGFSTFYIANSTSLLPANLLSFTAKAQDGIAQLSWTTTADDNTAKYVVQRSVNGLDFDSIAVLKAKSGQLNNHYQAADPSFAIITGTKVVYRLKVIDINGNINYSNSVSIAIASKKGSISARPNPVYNLATIDVQAIAAETVRISVTDNTGKTVLQSSPSVIKGSNSINVNMSMLPAGTYFLRITGVHISDVLKIQKL